MEEGKKKVSGYTILKAKLSKKEAEITELKAKVDNLTKENKVLNLQAGLEKEKAVKLQQQYNQAIHDMGWLRRSIFGY